MAFHQAPPSLGFSRQEHWSGLPFPSSVHESEKWKWSRSVVSDSWEPHGLEPTRLLCPWDFPGKSPGVGCHCLLWTNVLESSFQSGKNNFVVCYFFLWVLTKFLIRFWVSVLKNNLKQVTFIHEFCCYKMERVNANFQLEAALNGHLTINLCPKCRDKNNF